MKKVLAIALALVVLVSFAACTGSKAAETYEGDLSTVIASMYEKKAPEFMTCEAMPVDLSDPWALNSYLGLGNPDETAEVTDGNTAAALIKEAYFSESKIGSQAYSLVVARVNDVANIEQIKADMFEGINTRKWICVAADQLRVVSYADVIMLVMVSSELAPGLADGLVEAFAATVSASQVTGGDVLAELSGEILSRG